MNVCFLLLGFSTWITSVEYGFQKCVSCHGCTPKMLIAAKETKGNPNADPFVSPGSRI